MNTDKSAEDKSAEYAAEEKKAAKDTTTGTTSTEDSSSKDKTTAKSWTADGLLYVSFAFTLLALIAAFFWRESITVLFGTLLALTGIGLTFLVARQQDKETNSLKEVTNKVNEVSNMTNDITGDISDVSTKTMDIASKTQDITHEIKRVSDETNVITDKVNTVSGETKDIASETRRIAKEIRDTAIEVADIVEEIREVVRDNKEMDSEKEYLGPSDESDDDANELLIEDGLNEARPRFEAEAIDALRLNDASLDFDNLKWRPKTPIQKTRGNHGWFVESPGSATDERWFVRKARGMTARKAMPRKFLDALKSEGGVDPRNIKLDFQLKEHGLAAWYARTYDGALWKVWKANRNPGAGIQVKKIEKNKQ